MSKQYLALFTKNLMSGDDCLTIALPDGGEYTSGVRGDEIQAAIDFCAENFGSDIERLVLDALRKRLADPWLLPLPSCASALLENYDAQVAA